MKKLSYWSKYILAWLAPLIVSLYYEWMGMLMGFILALEYFRVRYLEDEPKV